MSPASASPEDLRIVPSETALLVVDFQERLAAAMPEATRASCERNVTILVALAARLGIPVVATEQYPKGLGATVSAITEALAAPGLDLRRFEKLTFSCTEAPPFSSVFEAVARRQWIVVGMEAHVCVYQTARGLLARGARVQVPRDAVISRTAANAETGLALMERAGAVLTSTEVIAFDALGCAGTDDFRAISRLVK